MFRGLLGFIGGSLLAGSYFRPTSSETNPPSLVAHAAREQYKGVDANVHTFRSYKDKVSSFSNYYEPFVLHEVKQLAPDVCRFRFQLHDPSHKLDLEPCSTLQACFKYGVMPSEQVVRFYTPVQSHDSEESGYFDLIVKRYAGGRMTEHLWSMHPGETMLFRVVAYKLRYKPNNWTSVGMIAGGTGITPMLQVLHKALKEPTADGKPDQTKLHLLFANRSPKHILCKDLLDSYARDHPDRFKLHYIVDRPEEGWTGLTGYIDERVVQQTLPAPGDPDQKILVCGPDALVNKVTGMAMTSLKQMSSGRNIQGHGSDIGNFVLQLGGVLGNLGYNPVNVYKF